MHLHKLQVHSVITYPGKNVNVPKGLTMHETSSSYSYF